MLRPYERSFNSGQMLRKLSPLNSTFDKSHYSLLSRASYRGPCASHPDLALSSSSSFPRPVFFPPFFFSCFTSYQPSISRKFDSMNGTSTRARYIYTLNRIKIRSKFKIQNSDFLVVKRYIRIERYPYTSRRNVSFVIIFHFPPGQK